MVPQTAAASSWHANLDREMALWSKLVGQLFWPWDAAGPVTWQLLSGLSHAMLLRSMASLSETILLYNSNLLLLVGGTAFWGISVAEAVNPANCSHKIHNG